jgi:prepilin-type processing-associated H-X9-DG protein
MEWIAVLAISGVVASIVLPVLGRAADDPDKDKATVCESNLKQLGLAAIMYMQDWDEKYPSGANWYGSGAGWAQQIRPYFKSTAILKCPSDTDPLDVVSYGYNSNCVQLTSYVPSKPTGQDIAAATSPADTVLFFEVANNRPSGAEHGYNLDERDSTNTNYLIDANSDIHRTDNAIAPLDGWSPGGRGTGAYKGELGGMGADAAKGVSPLAYATGPMSGSSPSSPYVSSAGRHQGRSGFAFLDGHVRMMSPNEVSVGKTNGDKNSPGADGKAAGTDGLEKANVSATFSL